MRSVGGVRSVKREEETKDKEATRASVHGGQWTMGFGQENNLGVILEYLCGIIWKQILGQSWASGSGST